MPSTFSLDDAYDDKAEGSTFSLDDAYGGGETISLDDAYKTPTKMEGFALGRGAVFGTIQNVNTTGEALEALGQITGNDRLIKVGKGWASNADRWSQGYEPTVSLGTLQGKTAGDTASRAATYVGEGAGQAVGSSVPTAAAAIAGAALGSPFGPGGMAAGAFAGASLPSYVQNYGDVYGSLKEDKGVAAKLQTGELDKADLAKIAAAVAVPIAALDTVSAAQITKPLTAPIKALMRKALIAEATKQVAEKAGAVTWKDISLSAMKEVGKDALWEGTTEGLQEIMSQATQAFTGATDFFTKDRMLSIADNFFAGTFGGGLFGGATAGREAGGKALQAARDRFTPEKQIFREIDRLDFDPDATLRDATARMSPYSDRALYQESDLYTPQDETSPLDSLVTHGMDLVNEGARQLNTAKILDEAGLPELGSRVRLELGKNQQGEDVTHEGVLEDVFTHENDELGSTRGIRVKLDNGSTFEDFLDVLHQNGARVVPVLEQKLAEESADALSQVQAAGAAPAGEAGGPSPAPDATAGGVLPAGDGAPQPVGAPAGEASPQNGVDGGSITGANAGRQSDPSQPLYQPPVFEPTPRPSPVDVTHADQLQPPAPAPTPDAQKSGSAATAPSPEWTKAVDAQATRAEAYDPDLAGNLRKMAEKGPPGSTTVESVTRMVDAAERAHKARNGLLPPLKDQPREWTWESAVATNKTVLKGLEKEGYSERVESALDGLERQIHARGITRREVNPSTQNAETAALKKQFSELAATANRFGTEAYRHQAGHKQASVKELTARRAELEEALTQAAEAISKKRQAPAPFGAEAKAKAKAEATLEPQDVPALEKTLPTGWTFKIITGSKRYADNTMVALHDPSGRKWTEASIAKGIPNLVDIARTEDASRRKAETPAKPGAPPSDSPETRRNFRAELNAGTPSQAPRGDWYDVQRAESDGLVRFTVVRTTPQGAKTYYGSFRGRSQAVQWAFDDAFMDATEPAQVEEPETKTGAAEGVSGAPDSGALAGGRQAAQDNGEDAEKVPTKEELSKALESNAARSGAIEAILDNTEDRRGKVVRALESGDAEAFKAAVTNFLDHYSGSSFTVDGYGAMADVRQGKITIRLGGLTRELSRAEIVVYLKGQYAPTSKPTPKPPAVAPSPAPTPKVLGFGENNKIFTADAAEKARAILRKKLGQMSANPAADPELMQAGLMLAGYYIEGGFRSFGAYAKAIIGDLGEAARPYLRGWYENVRHYPGVDTVGFSDAAEIAAYEKEHANDGAGRTEPVGDTSKGPLEGVSTGQVRGPEEQGDAGQGSARRGDDDSAGNAGDAGRGVQPRGSVAGDQGAVPVPTGERPGPVRGTDAGKSGAGRGENGERPEPKAGEPGLIQQPRVSYVITVADRLGEGGAVEKYNDNIAAIRLMKNLQEWGRLATPEEQAVLVRYVGWGGLKQTFGDSLGKFRDGWQERNHTLRGLLTEDQYKMAERTVLDAHYTSETVVRGIYKAVAHMGFEHGRVLEPSMGTGNFFGLMPLDMRSKSALTGVEYDATTGNIAKQLYQDQNVLAPMGFQDAPLADDHFDLAVGNPPFGAQKVPGAKEKAIKDFSIHNYFFARTLHKLRPGGIMAMVVTKNFLDKAGGAQREYIADRAKFLGAIRLPNTAFKTNALTEVTTDIVFLQKLLPGEKASSNLAWLTVGAIPDPQGGEPIPVNGYFMAHPEMMLGRMDRTGSQYGTNEPTLADDGRDLVKALEEAIKQLPAGVYQASTTARPTADLVKASAKPAEAAAEYDVGAFYMEGKKLYRRVESADGTPVAEELTADTQWTEKTKLGKAKYDRIVGQVAIRNAARKLLSLEAGDAKDKELDLARKQLNKLYDAFVEKQGYLNSTSNEQVFRDDPDAPLLIALEDKYDAGVSDARAKTLGVEPRPATAKKAAIFRQRVIPKYEPVTKAANARDALAVSLAERGEVNIAHMAKLTGKTEADIIAELFDAPEAPLIFKDPMTAEWQVSSQYLSGNVKLKERQAREAGLFKNAEALRAVFPPDLAAADIRVKAGSSWVKPQYYMDFATHLFGEGTTSHVAYQPVNGQFIADFRPGSETKNYSQWGVIRERGGRVGGDWILNRVMNGGDLTQRDKHSDGTSTVNAKDTAAVQAKADEIKAEFEEWIMRDQARRQDLAAYYNEHFNNNVAPRYDGSHITLPGKVPYIVMRRHQRNAIWRSVASRNVLYDHVVGAGKTFTIIATAMELRRTGLAKKNMIVVPNHLVSQWAQDFYKLYPGAKILTMGKKDFTAKNRQRLMAKIATGDWDAVIIAHSSFGFIDVDPSMREAFMRKQINDIQASIDAVRQAEGKGGRKVADLVRSREKMEAKIKELLEKPRDQVMTFEQLGVDQLFVDEAHEFKNLFFTTAQRGMLGLGNPAGSKKAFDMFMKVRYLLDKQNNKGVIFATGTPISNSLSEMYTVQRYLGLNELEQRGILSFDAWLNTYGDVYGDYELDGTGVKMKRVTRLRKLLNMPSLMAMYQQYTDSVTLADIKQAFREENPGKEFPIPKIKGGKRDNTVVPRSEDQARYFAHIIERAKNIKPGGKDNMLAITMDARKAALDMRLHMPGEDVPGSKVNMAADKITALWKKWESDKGTQLVFCDLSIPLSAAKNEGKGLRDLQEKVAKRQAEMIQAQARGDDERVERLQNEISELEEEIDKKYSADDISALASARLGFSVQDDLKAKLIARGIPEREIAFIHDATTDDKKADLFDRVNAGAVRVLIGTTPKMGAGTNVQQRVVAEHHLDCPWRPSDIEQREGRVVRQGNLLLEKYGQEFEVELLAYATEQTYDARMWQVQEQKLTGIESLRNYAGELEMEEVAAGAASAAEMKAAATGNPLILEDVKLVDDIRKLEAAKRSYTRTQQDIEDQGEWARRILDTEPARAAGYAEDLAKAQAYLANPHAGLTMTPMDINGMVVHTREAANQAFEQVVEKAKADAPKGEKPVIRVKIDGKEMGQDAAYNAIVRQFGDTDAMAIDLDGTATPYINRQRLVDAIAGRRVDGVTGTVGGLPFEITTDVDTEAGTGQVLVRVRGVGNDYTLQINLDRGKVGIEQQASQAVFLLKRIPLKVEEVTRKSARDQKEAVKVLAETKDLLGKPWPKEDELKEKRARQVEVRRILSEADKPDPVLASYGDLWKGPNWKGPPAAMIQDILAGRSPSEVKMSEINQRAAQLGWVDPATPTSIDAPGPMGIASEFMETNAETLESILANPPGWENAGGEPQSVEDRQREQEEWARTFDILRSDLDRLGLKTVRLDLPDVVTVYDREGNGHNVNGAMYPNVANPEKSSILVAFKGVDFWYQKHVLGHEALHAFTHMGLITPQEWQILKNAEKLYGWRQEFNIDARYPNATEGERIEEAIAEAMGSMFAQGKDQFDRTLRDDLPAGLAPWKKAISEIAIKIFTFIEAVNNWARGLGYTNSSDLLHALANGAAVGRTPGPRVSEYRLTLSPASAGSMTRREFFGTAGKTLAAAVVPKTHTQTDELKAYLRSPNATLKGALATIARTSTNSTMRGLAQIVNAKLQGGDVSLHVVPVGVRLKEKVPGALQTSYGVTETDLRTGEIAVYLRDDPDLANSGVNEETVVHEAIHAAVKRGFGRLADRANKFLVGAATAVTNLEKASERLMMVRHQAIGVVNRMTEEQKKSLPPQYTEALGSPEEFITYGLTSKPFQNWLATVPYQGKYEPLRQTPERKAEADRLARRSLWEAFRDGIKAFFSSGPEQVMTLFDATMDAGYSMLENLDQSGQKLERTWDLRGYETNQMALPSAPRVAFDDPEGEAAFQDARLGVRRPSTFRERITTAQEAISQTFRHYKHLPVGARFADVNEQLRKLEAAPQASKETVVRYLRKLTEGMSPEDLELFTRKVILDDLTYEATQGHPLPFNLTAATLPAEVAKVDDALRVRPDLIERVRLRKRFVSAISQRMVDAGVLDKERIKNPAYYRHVVLEYARAQQAIAATPGSKLESPRWAKRMGSELAINANLLEAEFDWLHKALTDIATANTITWIKNSNHNVRADVQRQVRESNKQGLEDAIAEDIRVNGFRMKNGRLTSDLNEISIDFKRRIGMGLAKIREELESGALVPSRFHQEAADAVMNGDMDAEAPLFPFLGWILDNDKPGAMGAAMVFKAMNGRKAWMKKVLGDSYMDPMDLKRAVRKFAPGYSAWQPEEGKLLFTAKTIGEHVVDGFMDRIASQDAGPVSVQELREAMGTVKTMLVVGGDRYQAVLPDELAATLNQLRDDQAQHIILTLIEEPQKAWKRWTLISPRRVLKYNLNNLSGDLDAVIAGNPKALRRMRQAIGELYQVMYKGAAPSARYQEALSRGVFDSGISVQEIPDINELDQFQHLINPPTWREPASWSASGLLKVWRFLQKSTQFRENWLRYAAYLDYAERLDAGESMETIGYGASKREVVDAVTDMKDRAALLARDLVGDYGAVSHTGQMLRRFVMPFYSWMEVNARRYTRLFTNAWQQGIGQGLATTGLIGASLGVKTSAWLLLRIAAVYGLMNLWNYLWDPEDEQALDDSQRAQMHLMLGKGPDGQVNTLRMQGALSDFLGWFGLADAAMVIGEIEKGRASLGELLGTIARAPINKIMGGLTPLISVPLELATGQNYWPDFLHPTPIRDPWRNIAQTFGVENEYDLAAGTPSRGFGASLKNVLVYSRDPGEISYNKMRGMTYDWLSRVKGEDGYSTFSTARSAAMYEWKLAQRYGDREAEAKAYQKLRDMHVTAEDRAQAIKRMNPLGALALKDHEAFRRTLTPDERIELMRAQAWYKQTFRPH